MAITLLGESMRANWREVRSDRRLSAAMSVGSEAVRTLRRVPLRALRSFSRAACRSLCGMLARTMRPEARSTSEGSMSPWWRDFLPTARRMPPMRPAASAKATFWLVLGLIGYSGTTARSRMRTLPVRPLFVIRSSCERLRSAR